VRLAEHDYEPVRGLPERLPEGERLLWQGAPQWRILARRALHLPLLATYFGVLIAARMAAMAMRGESPSSVMLDSLWFLIPSIAVLGMGALFAWGVARTSVYTITTRRIVMRFGIGFSVTANLPFARVEAAAARLASDGSGDVSVSLTKGERISWLFFWPHVRGWRLTRPQPTLRAIESAEDVARILSRALAGAADIPVTAAPTIASPDASTGAQPAAA
jgi:Bacterial PH domain